MSISEYVLVIFCFFAYIYCAKRIIKGDPQMGRYIIYGVSLVTLAGSIAIALSPVISLIVTAMVAMAWAFKNEPWVIILATSPVVCWLATISSDGMTNIWIAVVRHYYGG